MNEGKICVSVTGETADEMIANIRRAEEFADIVEVRFDSVRPDQVLNLRSQISDLKFSKKLLVTFRPRDQGGYRELTFDERRDFWSAGPATEYCDVEMEFVEDSGVWSWESRICSFHNFSGVPKDIEGLFDRLAKTDAEIIKIAVTARDITDAIPVWNLIEYAEHYKLMDPPRVIPIAMGDAGKWTRILGLANGAFLTYASLDEGKETAGGQITAKDLRDVYRVKELSRETRVFGVIGDPVSASVSPYMQNPSFVDAGIDAVFLPLLVKDIEKFMRRMVRRDEREVELNFGGFSVTMPHKQAIIRHLDAIDPTAERIGAVNTVKIENEKLTGYNTDAHGFITPLKERFGDLKGANVAMFGAGGAARACVFALKNEEADVTVFARDAKKAEAFGHEFEVAIEASVNGGKPKIGGFDILVDATPIGMKGPLENETLFTADELLGVRFVYDLVTKPTDTPLLAEAKKAGVEAIGGIEMLIAQGAMQFQIWTGREAPVELMRTSLLARMTR